ncbi:helix-turn-helix domain-containing protein [Ferdinandcohnia sp. SAFN-114]|uniref:helix-turn-helix domain-containing protein n=1 Tax=Ferdinandcohnia sp. SAFN-114 TaxID=3387275 RepID=UPI003F7D8B75
MVKTFDEIDIIENDVERLIILRKRLEKSQYEFAKALGVSSSYLGQIENYKVPFTVQFKERINDYLKQEYDMNEQDLFSDL